MINLGLDFTPRDLVDSYGPEGYVTCPASSLQRARELMISYFIFTMKTNTKGLEVKTFSYYQFETSTLLKRTLRHTYSLSTTTQ